jgi:flagellar hook assembly protein FlgD
MTVPRSEHVELSLYDIAGRMVRRLAAGTQLPGSWRVPWDGRDEAGSVAGCGVYFARMRWPGGSRVARIIVLR